MTPAMQSAVSLVVESGYSLSKAASTHGVSTAGLRLALARSGQPSAPTAAPATRGMSYGVERAIDLVVQEGYNISEAARACKVDLTSVRRSMRRLGYPPQPNSGRLKLF